MDTNINEAMALEDNMPSEVRLVSFWKILWKELKSDKTAMFSLVLLITLVAIIFIGTAVLGTEDVVRSIDVFNRNEPPTWWRWGNGGSATGGILGTDEAGRDMLHILIVSAQNSLIIGLMVSVVTIIVGLVVGLFAGYYGGHIDNVTMRFLDMIAIIPTLMMMIVLRVLMTNFTIWHMVFLLSLFAWTGRARLIRNLTMGQRVQDYVDASRTLGTRNITIIFKKILPNLTAMVSADIILTLGFNIGVETGLTMLGFGLPPGTPSLGSLIGNALQSVNMQFRQWNWVPAIVLVFTIMFCINFVGQVVSRAANAQQRLS